MQTEGNIDRERNMGQNRENDRNLLSETMT